MLENLKQYNIILGSKSPRRKQLLAELGIDFEVRSLEVDEVYPHDLSINLIPEYLAELKAAPFKTILSENDLLITSDTIVCLNNEVLGKPEDYKHAVEMLQKLSGKVHQVATGVCVLSSKKKVLFTSETNVRFKELSLEEIDYYISNYKPFDKAGAYGIQEWIGHIGVEQIEGSYFNVMGLPIQRLYEELSKF
ncbi:MAG: Maf family nucleotide pyrophosphatase [Prolixibacteraceae bacterium]|jgi:septum formation protein|nr:Maf family nucleotide pyrophosphatase [Prolixibacteraceae bacterium]